MIKEAAPAEEAEGSAKGLNFEEVWKMFQDTDKKFQDTDKKFQDTHGMFQETDRKLRELERTVAETNKSIHESLQETGKYIKRLSKNIGGLNDSMGTLIEILMAARLWEHFDAYPYNLKRAYRRVPIYDHKSNIITDIDILLSNSDYAMAVEVKRELNKKEDVDHHERRMKRILTYPPDEIKGKKLLGALAGGAVDPDVMEYAHSKGFFVLELSGKNVSLVQPPEGFVPTEWC
jgi:hypothetical protein